IACPNPGCTGELTERRSRRGKIFYGCDRYPECTFAAWDKPVAEACPECGSPYLLQKFSKREGPFLACPNSLKGGACTYRRSLSEDTVEGASASPVGTQPVAALKPVS